VLGGEAAAGDVVDVDAGEPAAGELDEHGRDLAVNSRSLTASSNCSDITMRPSSRLASGNDAR